MTKEAKKVGRSSKYDPQLTPKLAQGYAMDGMSDVQIAKKLGISQCTFYDWASKHPEFSEAVKKGKEPANTELKVSMMKTATGYYVEEEETVEILDAKTKIPKSFKKTIKKKYIPPNATMQIFLAKNRMPEQFRDVNRCEITGADGGAVKVSGYNLDKLSEEELLKLDELLAKAEKINDTGTEGNTCTAEEDTTEENETCQ